MKHLPIVLASVAVLAAGCGDEEPTAKAPATTPEPAATTTAATTPEPTEEPAKGGCRTGAVQITITGGEGVPCKLAKRIYRAYINGDPVPKGWECDVRACTNIESEDVQDFTWK